DLDAAAYLTIQSAYATSGQRCTCARRLIVPVGNDGDRFVDRLNAMIDRIRVGRYTDTPEPFMGPVASAGAAEKVLAAQDAFKTRGGKVLRETKTLNGCRAMLSPGLMDVTSVADRADEEIFGPFLQLIRVADVPAAIEEANRTRYGLAAGLLSDNADLYRLFYRKI